QVGAASTARFARRVASHSHVGRYGIFGRDRVGSLRLDAGGLDHFRPLLGFGSNVLAELSGWATERCGAEVGKPRLGAALIALLRVSITSAGVLLGAQKPPQKLAS